MEKECNLGSQNKGKKTLYFRGDTFCIYICDEKGIDLDVCRFNESIEQARDRVAANLTRDGYEVQFAPA